MNLKYTPAYNMFTLCTNGYTGSTKLVFHCVQYIFVQKTIAVDFK